VTDDLVAFLKARLDEDEHAARAACGTRGHLGADTGEHWRWEHAHHLDPLVDTPVDIEADTAADNEFIGDGRQVDLRSIEEYPFRALPGSGPHVALTGTEEVAPGVALHVARHDPARVLRGVEAKRRIVQDYEQYTARLRVDRPAAWNDRLPAAWSDRVAALHGALKHVAAEWNTHPDYQEAWRP
jgi:uncharacterized protein DUF6221